FRKVDLLALNLFPGNQRQEIGDAIQSCSFFVVGPKNVPGSVWSIGGIKHHVTCPRVLIPALTGRKIDLAQFPLTQRVLDACLKAPLLLLIAYFKPKFNQRNSTRGEGLLEERTEKEKALVFLWRAKAHDVFNAGAVIPTAIEDHDFPSSRKVLNITLHV